MVFQQQQTHPKMSAEEICKIFCETALKPEKCVDFDLKYWIEKYDLVRKEPRFAEIAMLIMSAAQIYGRKVDYVEEFILNLCKSFASMEQSENKDGSNAETLLAAAAADAATENRPKRRTKRMRPEMLSEKLVRTEYVPKPSKIVALSKVTEKIHMTLEDDDISGSGKKIKPPKRSLKQDIQQWKLNFPDEQGKTKPRAAKLKIEEEELYSRYTNFGKTYLYEDDDVIGVKKDFKVFAGYIDPVSNALLSDLNMRKFYKLQSDSEGEPFDEESMNQECDFLEDTRGGSPCRISDRFLEDCPSMDVDEDIDPISPDCTPNTTGTDVSSTLDTTGGGNNSSLANASHSTELNTSAEAGSTNTTLDLSSRVIPQMVMKSKVVLKVEPELKLNILGLPEKMLRRKAPFALPKEITRKPVKVISVIEEQPPLTGEVIPPNPDFVFESGIILGSESAKKPEKAKMFINLSADLRNIPTPPPSPGREDEEDFLGFDESPEFNDSSVFSSTLARLSLDSSLFLPPKGVERSMSQDSGFLTPPASLRFSCDEAGPSDLDSGLGSSSIDDDLHSPKAEKTIEADVIHPDPVEEDLPVELTAKHKQLQDQAEKRHQERLEANIDVTVEVNKWHSYLKPILNASHARANFDIHELGSEILESFPGKPPQVNEKITFEDVVTGKEQPDVCRYFLSTLLLANTENIRLSVGRKADNQVTEYRDMELAFLSSDRHYQEINDMYDTEGMINTNVKKRMRENDEGDNSGLIPGEKTPKKQKINKKAIAKLVDNSPADSGYLSGIEEVGSNYGGMSPNSRKRSFSGQLVSKGKGKINIGKAF